MATIPRSACLHTVPKLDSLKTLHQYFQNSCRIPCMNAPTRHAFEYQKIDSRSNQHQVFGVGCNSSVAAAHSFHVVAKLQVSVNRAAGHDMHRIRWQSEKMRRWFHLLCLRNALLYFSFVKNGFDWQFIEESVSFSDFSNHNEEDPTLLHAHDHAHAAFSFTHATKQLVKQTECMFCTKSCLAAIVLPNTGKIQVLQTAHLF